MSGTDDRAGAGRPRAQWGWRALEALLLIAGLVGVVLFASSALDIWRIESSAAAATSTAATREIPWNAWYGIFTFLASMTALRVLRWRTRRPERVEPLGSTAVRGRADLERLARVTSEVLEARMEDEADEGTGPALYSGGEVALSGAEKTGQG